MLTGILKEKIDNVVINNLTNALGAGLSILDRDLTIVWANKTLSAILNLKNDPVGKKCFEVYNCECRDTIHCSVLKAFSSGKKQCSEIQLVTEKGERKYINNISTPITDGDDNLTHLLKLSLDITEQFRKVFFR